MQDDINEVYNVTTRFRLKDGKKSELLNDSGLRATVIEGLTYNIIEANGEGYEGTPEYHEVFGDIKTSLLETIYTNDPLKLYSDLGEDPNTIKFLSNDFFEIEYIED